MIHLFESRVTAEAIAEVMATLQSRRLNQGAKVKEFESQLESGWGLTNPLTVNSCTSALLLALRLANVGPGDEVILPAQTFIATGVVVKLAGATPVWADIQPHTGNIDPSDIDRKITPRTKAVIVVDWGGLPCDLSMIKALLRPHGIPLIEDAAQAFGASYEHHPIGSVADHTCFSLQAIKCLTTGDGGVLCCRNVDDYKRARRLRWFGIDREELKVNEVGERVFTLSEAGYKFHMNDLIASLGIGNLRNLESAIMFAGIVARTYTVGLENLKRVKLLKPPTDRVGSHWFFSLLVDDPAKFIKFMKAGNVESSVVDLRIDRHPVFDGGANLPDTEEFNQHHVALPTHSYMSLDDVGYIIKLVKEYDNLVDT